ncbi:MAG: serine/threonine-protein kinase [Polyangiaceae bacterium]
MSQSADRTNDAVARWETLGRTQPDLRLEGTIRAELAATIAASPSVASSSIPPAAIAEDIELGALLGEGGMGLVYSAEQRSLQRQVAVKTVRAVSDVDSEAVLAHEARVTGALEHPNVVPVHVLVTGPDGRPFLVMKRVEGSSLLHLCKQPEHPLWASLVEEDGDRLTAFVEILVGVCHALELAHARGIVHRDIKLENIMVGDFGTVYLLDWGVATHYPRRTGPPELLGTPAYLAPEMAEGRPELLGPHTDIYLLGATLHDVLVGEPRHPGKHLMDVIRSAVESRPFEYPPSVPRELAELCNAATSRDPSDRPANVAAFRKALRVYLSHRASNELSRSATGSLERAEAAALTSDETRVHLTEAQFGFKTALGSWPQNPEARAGLTRALRLSFERDLAMKNPVGARAALAELGSSEADMTARVEAIEAELREHERRAEAVEALRKDMDPTPAIPGFAALITAILVLGSLFTVVSAHLAHDIANVRLTSVLFGNVLALVGTVAGMFLYRRIILRTGITRRIAASILCQLAGVVLALTLLTRSGIEDARVGSAVALVVLSATFAVVAVMSLPAVWICSFITGLGAVLVVEWRDHSGLVAVSTHVALAAALVWLFRAGKLRPKFGDVID